MKTISRTSTRKIAAIRGMQLLALRHSLDASDATVKTLTTASEAWAAFDRDPRLKLFDAGDGSFEIGWHKWHGTRYQLAPEGHAVIERHLLGQRRAAERRAAQLEADQVRMHSALANHVTPTQLSRPGQVEAVDIRIEWSESGEFESGQMFSSPDMWDEVNTRARRQMLDDIGQDAPGYSKTQFTVIFADGYELPGRWDIAANGHDGYTLQGHILQRLLWAVDQGDQGAADLLARYRVGPAPVKPRAQFWADGTPVQLPQLQPAPATSRTLN